MARRVGRLAALATAAALLASCTGDGTQTADVETDAPTDASAIETPSPSTTPTPQPPPSPGPSPSATATQPADGLVLAGDLLLASDEGVAVDRGGEPRTLTAIPARRAFHDGAGGVVFQGVAPPQPQAPSPAIMWLPPDGSDAVTVVGDGAAERVALHDAAVIDGTPTAVYTASTGDQPQTAEETLRLLRLPDGPTQPVAVVGGWESGARSVSHGGELFGVYRFAEASTWFAFYGPDGEALELDVNPLPERDACVDDVSCPVVRRGLPGRRPLRVDRARRGPPGRPRGRRRPDATAARPRERGPVRLRGVGGPDARRQPDRRPGGAGRCDHTGAIDPLRSHRARPAAGDRRARRLRLSRRRRRVARRPADGRAAPTRTPRPRRHR